MSRRTLERGQPVAASRNLRAVKEKLPSATGASVSPQLGHSWVTGRNTVLIRDLSFSFVF